MRHEHAKPARAARQRTVDPSPGACGLCPHAFRREATVTLCPVDSLESTEQKPFNPVQ
jgi:hypothetical protein